MVAYAPQAQQMRPMDTGVIFNGSVRVWLMTDDPFEASQCGARLHELGLPRQMRLIQAPAVKGLFAVNPESPKVWSQKLGREVPQFLKYKNSPMILETTDPMDLMRFYKWLHQKNPKVAKPKKPVSLNGLAEAGEIETIDAG